MHQGGEANIYDEMIRGGIKLCIFWGLGRLSELVWSNLCISCIFRISEKLCCLTTKLDVAVISVLILSLPKSLSRLD